jgi:hypothetical protein
MAKDTEEKASQEVDEAYRPIDPDAKAKSEAVQELFNFAKSKLPQRTRLNLKEIHQFAIMMANMAVIKESEVRTWVECYMDFLMELKISLGGEGRREGLQIFETQQQAEAMENALTG